MKEIQKSGFPNATNQHIGDIVDLQYKFNIHTFFNERLATRFCLPDICKWYWMPSGYFMTNIS